LTLILLLVAITFVIIPSDYFIVIDIVMAKKSKALVSSLSYGMGMSNKAHNKPILNL
jgi:hypothetical protein